MSLSPLISAPDLQALLAREPGTVLLDCSFDLADPEAGLQAWRRGHLPGARYLHLEHDLAGPKTDAAGVFRGRHPLRPRAEFAALMGELGIRPGTRVVAYDRQAGMFAARAWWVLRWMGHAEVQLLDGGLAAWEGASGALDTGAPPPRPAPPYPTLAPQAPTIEADALLARLGTPLVLDARAPERYRGEVEPLDRVAGHIPGARNRFFKDNLQPDGRFKPAQQLRAEFEQLLQGRAPAEVVHQCGSGATACHNLLAMEVAGLGGGSLYPGSWSEWSHDPARPVETGPAARD